MQLIKNLTGCNTLYHCYINFPNGKLAFVIDVPGCAYMDKMIRVRCSMTRSQTQHDYMHMIYPYQERMRMEI